MDPLFVMFYLLAVTSDLLFPGSFDTSISDISRFEGGFMKIMLGKRLKIPSIFKGMYLMNYVSMTYKK